ncbi:MAG: hypothetical protein ACRD3E_20540 [Terriglobales bacterium]
MLIWLLLGMVALVGFVATGDAKTGGFALLFLGIGGAWWFTRLAGRRQRPVPGRGERDSDSSVDDNSPFDPNEMQATVERLKAEGRLPPMEDFLRAMGDIRAKYRDELLEERRSGSGRERKRLAASEPNRPLINESVTAIDSDQGRKVIRVIRPGNDPLPHGMEIRDLWICTQCGRFRGQWRPKGMTHTPGSRLSICYYTQLCKCEEADDELHEEWPGFDFKRAIELCHCCGAEPILTGSKYSPWFCADCEEFVYRLNRSYSRYVIPFGRHSLHAGLSLTGVAANDPSECDAFAVRWREVSNEIAKIEEGAAATACDNLRRLGFTQAGDVKFLEYRAALRSNPPDKELAFRRLCALVGIQT